MNIRIGRYESRQAAELRLGESLPENVHAVGEWFEGWIEPEDRSWILFITAEGEPILYLHRDEDGGVIGEPVTREPLLV